MSDAFQPTDLSPSPGGKPARPVGTPRPADPAASDGKAAGDRVGVVFIHGIGAQRPAETFLDWSAAIVTILTSWRTDMGLGSDPVVRSQFSLSPAARPYLELDIPEVQDDDGRTHHRSTWILTEAWWADAIRPPSLDAAAAYLRDRLTTIVSGIRKGSRIREPSWQERKATIAVSEPSDARQPGDAARAALLEEVGRRRWSWIPKLDGLQRTFLTQLFVVVPAIALGTLLLAVWVPLRRLPLGPLRDFVDARLVDSFLTDWFGDLPVILDDPVQAANVRARVAETVRSLNDLGCGRIVLVGHSGGAIVSFATLLDPAYLPAADRGIRVDKLITHGEGLNLGWRLETAHREVLEEGHRLRGDLGALREDLRWVDIWSSFDPAPAGPLDPPDGVTLEVGRTGDSARSARDPRPDTDPPGLVVESRPVTNLMSLRGDHGAYWTNDEGYLVPLLRHIDDAAGSGGRSRFYRDRELRTLRIERRRQRVAALAAWRWAAAVAAIVAIIGGGFTAGAVRLAGESLGRLWSGVPGGELIGGPADAVWRALVALFVILDQDELAASIASFGPVLLGAVAIGTLFTALGSIGSTAWSRWDFRERRANRPERLVRLDRTFAMSLGSALLVGLATVVVEVFLAGEQRRVLMVALSGIVLATALAAIVALAGRSRRERPDPP
jgi:hypothetical protein